MAQQTLKGCGTPQPYMDGPHNERPFEGHGRCKKCNGPMTIKYGPWGRNAQLFAQVGCKACKLHDHYLKWPTSDRSVELQHLRGSDVCGCGAVILWAITGAGERMPLNPRPIQTIDVSGQLHTGRESHFKTCPHADAYRKRYGKR